MTGLRADELASLTPASFDLKTDPPTITIAAGYSKHRREADRHDFWTVGTAEHHHKRRERMPSDRHDG